MPEPRTRPFNLRPKGAYSDPISFIDSKVLLNKTSEIDEQILNLTHLNELVRSYECECFYI